MLLFSLVLLCFFMSSLPGFFYLMHWTFRARTTRLLGSSVYGVSCKKKPLAREEMGELVVSRGDDVGSCSQAPSDKEVALYRVVVSNRRGEDLDVSARENQAARQNPVACTSDLRSRMSAYAMSAARRGGGGEAVGRGGGR
jgi:hypothetical protein